VRLAMGPPGLPREIVHLLEQAFFRVVQEPDFVDWAQKIRVEIVTMNHEQCMKYVMTVEREISKYVDRMNIKK